MSKDLIMAIAAVGLTLIVVLMMYRAGYNAGRNEVMTEWRAAERQYADAAANIIEHYRQVERDWSERMRVITDELHAQLQASQESAADTIADLRDGNLRLQERFRACRDNPRMPDATATASINHGASDGGLSDADVGFLIRESERADRVTNQLAACQNYIRSITTQ